MGIRRVRRMQRQFDMAKSRRENGMVKSKERVRRDLRITALVKKGKLPYIPSVMSWLSEKLDMPSSKIQQADIDKLLAPPAA
ncbi:MAG: hypothetical protein ACRC33_00060 [Gemmataceae bacterium]